MKFTGRRFAHTTRRTPAIVRAAVIAALAVALGAAALLGGCGVRSQPVAQPVPPAPAPTATTAPAEPVLPEPLSRLNLEIQPSWRGFTAPLYLTNAGDGSGRLFIVQQGGEIRVVRDGNVVKGAFLDVGNLITSGGERGLLGLAFAPDYERSGRIYVNYTDRRGDTVIARYTAANPEADAPTWSVPKTVLTVKQPFPNHNGGCLQFGPDGLLYIGMGDGGSAGDPNNNAQNGSRLLGKLLRMDVSGSSFKSEIWSKGLRNPWRFSFDASSGALWIGDVGQGAWEEIDYAAAGVGGQNWGWNRWEGTHPYPEGSSASSKSGLTFPIHEYPHPQGESVTGGYVYRGQDYPALVGTYVYADFMKGWIGGIRLTAPDGTKLAKPEAQVLLQTNARPSSFGVDETGELYLVDYTGTIYAVVGSAK